jgi:hypothetical protein
MIDCVVRRGATRRSGSGRRWQQQEALIDFESRRILLDLETFRVVTWEDLPRLVSRYTSWTPDESCYLGERSRTVRRTFDSATEVGAELFAAFP